MISHSYEIVFECIGFWGWYKRKSWKNIISQTDQLQASYIIHAILSCFWWKLFRSQIHDLLIFNSVLIIHIKIWTRDGSQIWVSLRRSLKMYRHCKLRNEFFGIVCCLIWFDNTLSNSGFFVSVPCTFLFVFHNKVLSFIGFTWHMTNAQHLFLCNLIRQPDSHVIEYANLISVEMTWFCPRP